MDPAPEWLWIWRAWRRLSAERGQSTEGFMVPMGGGLIQSRPGSIPWTAVRAWADHHGLSLEEMALLDRCLVAMDRVYASHWAEKQKASLK
ncbi:hypothetical protein [Gluconobacter sp. Gdi]|uniref:phage tail assembly chaperone n=1 Tax=Gluconobacter sp. Gdi TaxID=2691888 RepID=UPI0019213FC4|nr:hypothetical protein [Gluconobacter sp. Gdi]